MKSALTLLGLAALASAGAAVAQAPATTVKTVQTHSVTKPTAAPVSAHTTKVVTKTATPVPGGRMITTKTATGKTITYDCSKAGNAAKKACKH